jgi:hypothetical protein
MRASQAASVYDWESADAFLRGGRTPDTHRKIAHSTIVNRRGEDIAVTLHATDVVTYHKDGSATLSTGGFKSYGGGWDTPITWDRIRTYGPAALRVWSWQVKTLDYDYQGKPRTRRQTLKAIFHESDPLTAPNVKACRDCGGTGRHVYTTGGDLRYLGWNKQTGEAEYEDEPEPIVDHNDPCDRCNGTGQRDYGSRPDPIVFRNGIRVRGDGSVVNARREARASQYSKAQEREAKRLDRERKAREAEREAARIRRIAEAVTVSDGTAVYYKGLDRLTTGELTSPVQTHQALVYTPGQITDAGEVNLDPFAACAAGVNFVRTINAARSYGSIVVSLTVPAGEEMVDAGDKLRARRVLVGTVVEQD